MTNSKKRAHDFARNAPKKRRMEEQQAPARDHPTAILSQSNNYKCVAALALEDVGATVSALKESMV